MTSKVTTTKKATQSPKSKQTQKASVKPVQTPKKDDAASREALKQRQLDMAYSKLHEINSRLFNSEQVIKSCQNTIKESSHDKTAIEQMLFSSEMPVSDVHARRFLIRELVPWLFVTDHPVVAISDSSENKELIVRILFAPTLSLTDSHVRNYLMEGLENRVRRINDCQAKIKEQKSATKEDRKRSKSIKDRINSLHINGPDPQQEFDLDDTPVDGKSAAVKG